MDLGFNTRFATLAGMLGLAWHAGCGSDRTSEGPAASDAEGSGEAGGSEPSSSSASSSGASNADAPGQGTTAGQSAEGDSSRGGSIGDLSGTTSDPAKASGGGAGQPSVGGEGGAPSGVGAEPPATGGQPAAGGNPSVVIDIPELAPPPGILTTHKVDLLFVIDNSASMQDKQVMFAQAATDMLAVLVNPPCVDESGTIVEQPSTPDAACSAGTRRISPVRDLHAGVITSSLGGHGNPDFCEDDLELNDQGHLVATRRTIEVPDGGHGFVAWGEDTTEGGPPRIQALDELSSGSAALW